VQLVDEQSAQVCDRFRLGIMLVDWIGMEKQVARCGMRPTTDAWGRLLTTIILAVLEKCRGFAEN
jgi:hypothetical protein